jgi:hypothetical protein
MRIAIYEKKELDKGGMPLLEFFVKTDKSGDYEQKLADTLNGMLKRGLTLVWEAEG